jgi:hypothetical protein
LLDLIKNEGTIQTEAVQQFIDETTKEFPEFKEIAALLLLREERDSNG